MGDRIAQLAIAQSELFQEWPAAPIERLVAQAETIFVKGGTSVISPADAAKYLYIVSAGAMSIFRQTPSSRKFVIGLVLPGEFFALGSVIAQDRYAYAAVCKEDSVLVRVPGDTLREVIAANGRLSFSLFAAMKRRHLDALHLHETAAVSSTRARISELLRSIEARNGRARSVTEIFLSQDEIASMLGTRRQVVNRALREIAAQGAIRVQYGKVSIIDSVKLGELEIDEKEHSGIAK